MSGTFSVEWQSDAILLVRRTGVLSVEGGEAYGAAVMEAMRAAPPAWVALVDLRAAGRSGEEVRGQIASIVQFALEQHVKQIVIVTSSAVDGLQHRRVTTAPGLLDMSMIAFYTDFDQALAASRRHLSD